MVIVSLLIRAVSQSTHSGQQGRVDSMVIDFECWDQIYRANLYQHFSICHTRVSFFDPRLVPMEVTQSTFYVSSAVFFKSLRLVVPELGPLFYLTG
jgi:hypothetical protein